MSKEMTPKEAFEMLEKCGTNTEQPYEDMILEALYQSLTSYEEMKHDVKRYFELQYKNQFDHMTQNEIHDMYVLRDKLGKVGNEE